MTPKEHINANVALMVPTAVPQCTAMFMQKTHRWKQSFAFAFPNILSRVRGGIIATITNSKRLMISPKAMTVSSTTGLAHRTLPHRCRPVTDIPKGQADKYRDNDFKHNVYS